MYNKFCDPEFKRMVKTGKLMNPEKVALSRHEKAGKAFKDFNGRINEVYNK